MRPPRPLTALLVALLPLTVAILPGAIALSVAPTRVARFSEKLRGYSSTYFGSDEPWYLSSQRQSSRHILYLSDDSSDFSTSDDTAPDLLFGVPRSTVAAPLALLLLSQFLLFIGVGAVIPAIPLYGRDMGLSSAANGIVISAPAVMLLLLSNFSGRYADRARKPAMILGMALIAVSDVGTALASSLPVLLVARFGLGMGRSVSEAGERGMLADLAGRVPELRGRALALQQVVVALGIAIGAPLGGWILERYSAGATFFCVSAAAAIAFCLYFFLPETMVAGEDVVMGVAVDRVASQRSVKEDDDTSIGGDWNNLLSDERWRSLAFCQAGASFGFAAKIASIPVLASTALPGGAVGAGALISIAGLSGIVGAPLGGYLCDRIGARSTAVASGIVSGVGLILIPLALTSTMPSWVDQSRFIVAGYDIGGEAAAFSALVITWSIGAAAQAPALTAVAQELAPPGAEATSMAFPRSAGDGTYIVAPFLLGLVADKVSEYPGAECAVAGGATLLGALTLFLGEAVQYERIPDRE